MGKTNVICTIPQSSPQSYVGGMFTFFEMDVLWHCFTHIVLSLDVCIVIWGLHLNLLGQGCEIWVAQFPWQWRCGYTYIIIYTYTGWWFGTGFLFIHSVGNNYPNWRTHIFQRGWNHQPDIYIYILLLLFIIINYYYCLLFALLLLLFFTIYYYYYIYIIYISC